MDIGSFPWNDGLTTSPTCTAASPESTLTSSFCDALETSMPLELVARAKSYMAASCAAKQITHAVEYHKKFETVVGNIPPGRVMPHGQHVL